VAVGRPPSFAVEVGSETLLEKAFDRAGACTGLDKQLEAVSAGETGKISYLGLLPGDVGLVGASSES
jgi:hypothetical protein